MKQRHKQSFQKLDDAFQININLFKEFTMQCDGVHENRVEMDNMKNKLCSQIIALHLLIQSLIRENKNDEDFFQKIKLKLNEHSDQFKRFCNLMMDCCQNKLQDQIKDLNEIFELNYKEIKMRFITSLDPKAEKINEKLMELEVNNILINANKFHNKKSVLQSYDKDKKKVCTFSNGIEKNIEYEENFKKKFLKKINNCLENIIRLIKSHVY